MDPGNLYQKDFQDRNANVSKKYCCYLRLPALNANSDSSCFRGWVSRPQRAAERKRLPSSGELLCGQRDHLRVLLWVHTERLLQTDLFTQREVERLHSDLQPGLWVTQRGLWFSVSFIQRSAGFSRTDKKFTTSKAFISLSSFKSFCCFQATNHRTEDRCLVSFGWTLHCPLAAAGDICADPGIPPGASRTGNIFGIDDKVIYRCTGNLFLVGSKERKCQENGQWTGKEPACYCENKTFICGCMFYHLITETTIILLEAPFDQSYWKSNGLVSPRLWGKSTSLLCQLHVLYAFFVSPLYLLQVSFVSFSCLFWVSFKPPLSLLYDSVMSPSHVLHLLHVFSVSPSCLLQLCSIVWFVCNLPTDQLYETKVTF